MVNQPIGNHGLGIFGVVRFDLGPLLQGQTRIAKLKSAHNLLIKGHTGLGWQNKLTGNHGPGIFLCGQI